MAVNGKAIKFRTLAERRVSRVLSTVRQIKKLSRRGNYEYTPEQVDRMFRAMRDELDAAELAFASTPAERPPLFQLDAPDQDA